MTQLHELSVSGRHASESLSVCLLVEMEEGGGTPEVGLAKVLEEGWFGDSVADRRFVAGGDGFAVDV